MKSEAEIRAAIEMFKSDKDTMVDELADLRRAGVQPDGVVGGGIGLLMGIIDALEWTLGSTDNALSRRITDRPGRPH